MATKPTGANLYSDANVLTEQLLDNAFDPLYTDITNTNISASAGINGSKLAADELTDREMNYKAIQNNLVFWMLR